jgi:hypothetical protein
LRLQRPVVYVVLKYASLSTGRHARMTFTVEIEKDYTKVVTLDDKSQHEDLEIYLEDNGTVFIRQYAETLHEYQVIHISYRQFIDMVKSLEADAINGMYRMETVSSSGGGGVQQ